MSLPDRGCSHRQRTCVWGLEGAKVDVAPPDMWKRGAGALPTCAYASSKASNVVMTPRSLLEGAR